MFVYTRYRWPSVMRSFDMFVYTRYRWPSVMRSFYMFMYRLENNYGILVVTFKIDFFA